MSGWGSDADRQENGLLNVTNQMNLRAGGDTPQTTSPISTSAEPQEDDEQELSLADASLIQKLIRSKLVKSTNDVEVQRKDPSSPLYSVKTFEELKLRPELLKGVYGVGFDLPSKIQETALPTLLADPPQNMIAQSQSGTGKTAAFILASLSRVDESQCCPQVVVLSPTYELAIQTGEVAKQMAKHTKITFIYAVRGATFERGYSITDHVVLGTPGKIIDWALKFKFFNLRKVKVFVLDEADVMIAEQGHHDQSIRIHKKLPETCQMMLFSATYDEHVMEFAQQIIPNPVLIRLRREEESLENIKQYYVLCSSVENKFNALSNIYGGLSIGQTIIFCHTRKTALWLSEMMTKEGHAVAVLSGELAIGQRIAVLERFRRGRDRVLITTNVCARGIDIEQVTVVVNFDLPVDQKGRANCETYLHRIGRTGRFGKAGLAVNMVDGPRTLALIKQIERHFGRPIRKLDADDLDEIEKIQK